MSNIINYTKTANVCLFILFLQTGWVTAAEAEPAAEAVPTTETVSVNETAPTALAAPTKVSTAVTLSVDYSFLPLLKIEANGVTPEEMMRSIGKEHGFSVAIDSPIDPELKIYGSFEGELRDLLRWMLRGVSYMAVTDEAGSLTEIHLVSEGGEDQTMGIVKSIPSHTVIDSALTENPDLSRDMRRFLEQGDKQPEGAQGDSPAKGSDASDTTPRMTVNLYDVPRTVSDHMVRISEPLNPKFGTLRMENRAHGTPPRYLTGANDAAQNDVAQSLSRTVVMAQHNLEALTGALDSVCFTADCPGITRAQIAERESKLERQQTTQVKDK